MIENCRSALPEKTDTIGLRAAVVQERGSKTECVDSCSPDLTPSVYHLLPLMKTELSGRHVDCDDTITAVDDFLKAEIHVILDSWTEGADDGGDGAEEQICSVISPCYAT